MKQLKSVDRKEWTPKPWFHPIFNWPMKKIAVPLECPWKIRFSKTGVKIYNVLELKFDMFSCLELALKSASRSNVVVTF